MTISTASIPTASASRLIKRLCKHWSHKFEIDTDEDASFGRIDFGHSMCSLDARDDRLDVTLEADDAELARMQDVVADHLQRMAAKEETLNIQWQGETPTPG